MPINPTYPGVYVQEAQSGTRTIIGVSTSVTAFIGNFTMGPVNTPVEAFNFGDVERVFGGLADDSEASYGLSQFFLNDGDHAWIVRVVGSNAATAASTLLTVPLPAVGTQALVVSASSPGDWGNSIYVDVDYNTTSPTTLFNLTVSLLGISGGQATLQNPITVRNLTLDSSAPNFAPAVMTQVAYPAVLLSVPAGTAATAMPAQTGTTGGSLTSIPTSAGGQTMQASIQIGTAPPTQLSQAITLPTVPAANPYTIYNLPPALQAAIRQVPQLRTATVQYIGTQLRVQLQDPTLANNIVTFSGALASTLQLDAGHATANVQRYVVGSATTGAQGSPVAGADGDPIGGADIMGSQYQRTGIFSLDAVDIFNLLSIPDTRNLSSSEANAVITAAVAYCEARRAFFLVDMPSSVNSITDALAWNAQAATMVSANSAVYFPSPLIADSLNNFRLRAVAPSGTMAGVYSRTDANKAVWFAAAGIDARLAGAQALSYKMTDDENGVLNPLAINALRTFPVYGNVAWGARTTVGSDAQASQWKYIPVRRTALYIEESLRRGLQWAVFQPNGEVLWSQIRLSAGAFMRNMFQAGAFQGQTPQEAYFVQCDATTTSQNDIDQGIVNVVVGFAPLKPAEFVIITLEQIAGQVQT